MTRQPGRSHSQSSRQRRRLWARRIITGLGLLAIVALLIWGIVSLVLFFVGGAASANEEPQSLETLKVQTLQSGDEVLELGSDQTITRDGIVSESEGVIIPTCASAALHYTLTASQTKVGEGETLSVSVENTGEVACMIHAGAWGVRIVSGEDTMYDSRACDTYDPKATPLLLAPGMSWSGTLNWDGHVYSEGCVAPAEVVNAEAGTYRAILMSEDRQIGEEVVFEVLA